MENEEQKQVEIDLKVEREKWSSAGYLTCLLDTSSSITISKKRRGEGISWVPRVVIILHRRFMADTLKKYFGGTVLEGGNRYRYEISNEPAAKLLRRYVDGFKDRKDQGVAFLKFFEATNEEGREKAYEDFMRVKRMHLKT